MSAPRGDLTVTALYTSGVWWWAGFSGAELLISREARSVFRVTNAALALVGCLRADRRSLRRGLADRHALIDGLAGDCGASVFVELAAGLSRRGLAFSADPSVRYVEVDLPAVIRHKETLLQRSEAGRRILARSNLQRVGADVASVALPSLVPTTDKASESPQRICVIAEGLMMYLDADQQRGLWCRIAAWLRDHPDSLFLFDLVPMSEQPAPGLLGRGLGALMGLFTGGRGVVVDPRDRHDIRRELLSCGFGSVELHEPDSDEGAAVPMLVFACRGWRSSTP